MLDALMYLIGVALSTTRREMASVIRTQSTPLPR
jgi:hypothetical protein